MLLLIETKGGGICGRLLLVGVEGGRIGGRLLLLIKTKRGGIS